MACLEALGPVVPAGWDASGQPVAAPWSNFRRPLVEIAAVSEDQVVTNTWAPLLDMLSKGPVIDNYPGTQPMGAFVTLPYGRIQKRTAAAGSAKGAPACFVVCDQTEEWVSSNGGIRLFETLKNNVIKRGGHILESPNAYTPGMGSVAENSMQAYQLMLGGKTRMSAGLMFDHREAPVTDLTDGDALLRSLAYAYGDSADIEQCVLHDPPCYQPGWVDLEHIKASIWDPDADLQTSKSDWLNQITNATDSWITQPDWAACADAEKALHDSDVVTLGFDGSVKDDSTALVACRVADGHLELLGCWEKPDKVEEWRVDTLDVDRKVRQAFNRFTVVGFYADPPLWQSYIDQWTQDFAPSTNTAVRKRVRSTIKVKAAANRPFEWWTNRPSAAEAALERFETAVRAGEISHDGGTILTMHVLNARRKLSGKHLVIGKQHPKSKNKIDAAMAAVLAFEARCDAIAQGVGAVRQRSGGGLIQRIN